MLKYCKKCNQYKLFSGFNKDKSRPDGYFLYCRDCQNKRHKQIRGKKPWLRTLESIKQRCTNPNNNKYHRYGGRGIECRITEEELKDLWFRDKASTMYQPTIDRIDNDGHYEYSNCRFIENAENIAKDKRKPILQCDLDGNFIREWDSAIEIEKVLGIAHQNIAQVVLNQRKTAGGYKWLKKN